jgi:hypothetical protein
LALHPIVKIHRNQKMAFFQKTLIHDLALKDVPMQFFLDHVPAPGDVLRKDAVSRGQAMPRKGENCQPIGLLICSERGCVLDGMPQTSIGGGVSSGRDRIIGAGRAV